MGTARSVAVLMIVKTARASLLVALFTLDNAGTAVAVTGFTQAELDAAAWPLNMRLRTSPGWKCPAEPFMPESFDI
jgi:hypothetical protein